jgi:hypothetical protein
MGMYNQNARRVVAKIQVFVRPDGLREMAARYLTRGTLGRYAECVTNFPPRCSEVQCDLQK